MNLVTWLYRDFIKQYIYIAYSFMNLLYEIIKYT